MYCLNLVCVFILFILEARIQKSKMMQILFLVLNIIEGFLIVLIFIIWYLKSIIKIKNFLRDSQVKSFNNILIFGNLMFQFTTYVLFISTKSLNDYNKIDAGCDESDTDC